ncbi:MAG: O-antigen ligase family protein, partial [Phycisphaerae bacterium]
EPSLSVVLMILLVAYIGLTRAASAYPLDMTEDAYSRLCKIVLVAILLTGLVPDARRVGALYAVIALSVGFWAIKGGIWTVILGPHQVYGTTYDNNLFALKSVMVLPMMYYFAQTLRRPRWRWMMLTFCALACLGILGSRSRSGFLALVFVLFCIGWSSAHRIKATFAVSLFALAAAAMSWSEIESRINSIRSYRQDKSAGARLVIWDAAADMLAQRPLFGVGFGNFERAYGDAGYGRWAAHNIWLQNLAELGLIGHPLWLGLLATTALRLWILARRGQRAPPDMRWCGHLSRGLLLALAAFWIHGMFHNEEYLELMFAIVGLSVAIDAAFRRECREFRLRAAAGLPARVQHRPEPVGVLSPHPSGAVLSFGRCA